MASGVVESYANMRKIFGVLGFPVQVSSMKFVSDFKLLNLVLGLQSCSSTHSCPYSECWREFKDKPGVKTGKQGKDIKWCKGIRSRTLTTIQEMFELWMEETEGDTSKLPNYMSCQHPPLDIFTWDEHCDEEIVRNYVPALLHCLLGCGNKALQCVSLRYPDEYKQFCENMGLWKSSWDFTGKKLQQIFNLQ